MVPLYKSLKKNGTTFYAFCGAAEDISSSYQNTSYKMYFSKYVLLNFPKQNTNPGSGTQSKPVYFDFDNTFSKSSNATPANNYSDQIVESLRNYVANQEVVIRESRLNNTKYYYDTNALETVTEKVFWKWCKEINAIDFEPAIPDDEYFSNLLEFQSNNLTDDEYFPEFLWKEREIIDWRTIAYYESSEISNKLEIEFNGTTNFRQGDLINIYNVSNATVINNINGDNIVGVNTQDGISVEILKVLPTGLTQGQRIVVDVDSFLPYTTETSGQARIIYNRLVQYVGEVNGVSNVQEANRSYTEVYAHIPDHTGMTPDVLFRTMVDVNYKPNMTFPIIPSQIQPEILGAESFNSPIVSSPQNYPGSYFGQFDTLDFTYQTENGDELRRSGDYYGVSGDINNPVVNGSTIDGVTLDFNTSHYVKMNIPNRVVTNFDQFNALEVNNEPPKDFEFNAILWYYTVEDQNGNSRTNLYGITFLDNPDNNTLDSEIGLRFPTYKKLVANGEQDGTSYAFSLNLNFNIINDNTVDSYNPEAINSMFSMNLFNEAMRRLASTNDSFLNTIAEQSFIREELTNIKGLLYTQTDLNVINAKIQNLENLLRLYSTNQLVSSDSIQVTQVPGNPPNIILDSTDTQYVRIDNYLATELYNEQGIIPVNVSVPKNKNFMINFINNDEVEFQLEGQDKLTIVLDKDLNLRQSLDINITANEFASQNKKLDIYMLSDAGSQNGEPVEVLVIGSIDLPVYYNSNTQAVNSAYLWRDFRFEIDFNQTIELLSKDRLKITFEENAQIVNNSIKPGDALYLNNFFVGTSSVYNFSGQYTVDSLISSTSSSVVFNMSANSEFTSFYENFTFPYVITNSQLSNLPYFSLNKGKRIRLNRVSNSSVLSERYQIQIDDII